MAELNSTIIEKVWLSATNDFQQRIPDPTQGSIDATIDAIMDPMNKQYYNQFIDALVMRIGDTYVHQQTFRNPLAVFKKSRMRYGSTLQEIIPKWIRAHSYVDDAEDVFKTARPDVGAWYHSQNRRDRYDITINRDELRTAFTEEGGLNRLVASILEVPMNSDEYDEYCIMKQLIAFYEHNWGFYKHHITAVTNESTAKAFLKSARAYAGKLQFPSCLYNSGKIEDIPVFVKPSELVLIITPEVQASIDVDALAVLFNVEKAEIKYRTILIDEFPINGAQALLTTEDFFMCKDTEYETTSAYNPKTLGTNYFLHHWGIYSVSPFVPAILFTTGNATTINTVTQSLSALSIEIYDDTPAPGDVTPINASLTGTLLNTDNSSYSGPIKLAPKACLFDVAITRGQTGVQGVYTITVGGTLASGNKITIDGTVTTLNSTSAASASAAATAVASAMSGNTNYTVTSSSEVITLTEKSGKYGIGMPSYSITSTAGTLTGAITTAGVSTTAQVADAETYVDFDGKLHVGKKLLANDVITVNATSTYVNPSGDTSTLTASDTATVTV